jgi:nucleoside-diphosphate-sugar epimerase
MRILITGNTGYIGSHLLPLVAKKYPQALISVCDAKEGQDYSKLSGYEFDLVYHLGAMSSIKDSFNSADKMMEVNALGLIPFFLNNKVGKFIFSSTGAVYGERDIPAKEDDVRWMDCVCPYSQSKYVAEGIIRRMCPNHVITRFGNVFGGNVAPRVEMLSLTHFQKDDPIMVYGGDQVRDFVHVDMVCRALLFASSRKDVQGTFNIATGKSTRIGDIAEQIGKQRGVSVIYKKAKKEDVVHTRLDVTKARGYGLITSNPIENDYSL